MRLSSSCRLAWTVTFASIMLWAVTAPATLGKLTGHSVVAQQSDPGDQEMTSCELQNSVTAANQQPAQDGEPGQQPGSGSSATSPTATSGQEATFVLCGGPDPETERAIEQLIKGRNFKTRLTSRPDGCADLTITVSPQSQPNLGRQSSRLTVSAGSVSGAPSNTISVQIVTENGVTRATIGTTTPAAEPPKVEEQPTPTPESGLKAEGFSGFTATFVLCGGLDPETERAIEQLINGRNFKTRLTSRPDGCADLTITVSPQSQPNLGRQSSRLTVSAGSVSGAPSNTISVQIVTENGVTRATIGAAR